MAGGYAGSGGQHAPYPEYQDWRPQVAPGGYPPPGPGYHGPDGYGETVNDSGYAYVIREDGPPAPPPSRASTRERVQGPGGWSPADAGAVPARTAAGPGASSGKAADAGKTQTAAIRAITAGADGRPRPGATAGSAETANSAATATKPRAAETAGTPASGDAGDAGSASPAGTASPASAGGRTRPDDKADDKADDLDPALAYERDDPAYGPPGPDWYKRRTPWAPDAGSRQDEEESPAVRGPFEPLRSSSEGDAPGNAGYRPAEDEPPRPGHDDAVPEPLDFGAPSDPDAGALGEIKDLYLTAETISPAGLDSHFEQLLERQRQLISEYFRESGGIGSTEPPPEVVPGTPDPSASPVPFGFDTAETLAALRGELRGAP